MLRLELSCFGTRLAEYKSEIKGMKLLSKDRFEHAGQMPEIETVKRQQLCRALLQAGLEKRPPTREQLTAYGQASLRMAEGIADAVQQLTRHEFTRTLLQHNQAFYKYIRDGVPVSFKDASGVQRDVRARVIDFQNGKGADGKPNNRFIAVREFKITGLRSPSYNRRADLVCFVNGLPLVFIELKAVYKNIRAGFDGNLRD